MWQRQDIARLVSPVSYPLGQALVMTTQIVVLCVLTYQQGQADIWQLLQQLCMPLRCTLSAWRQLTAFAFSRVTKAHRHNGKQLRVIKLLTRDLHPVAQSITAEIIPGCD